MSSSKVKRLAPLLLKWFSLNARDLPWRRTSDPYAIWVSEIMLQQTQVKTVIPYWERWMHALPTVESLAEAKPERIHKLWEGLGYYTRVRNMQKAAQEIVANHGGQFPRDYENILALPGIGRYTAGAIASIAFNEPRPILDGNVIRVLTRLFGIAENPREKSTNQKLWRLAEEFVQAAAQRDVRKKHPLSCSHLNQALMELGALICAPRQPACALCPVRPACAAFRTGRVEVLPNLGPRIAATTRRFVALVVEHRGRWLVRQRPVGMVNGHLWEFPNVEIALDAEAVSSFKCSVFSRKEYGLSTFPSHLPARSSPGKGDAGDPVAIPGRTVAEDALKRLGKKSFGLDLERIEKLCVIKHTITRYRITLETFRAKAKNSKRRTAAGERWLKPEELDSLAFSSAHRKILKYLEKTE